MKRSIVLLALFWQALPYYYHPIYVWMGGKEYEKITTVQADGKVRTVYRPVSEEEQKQHFDYSKMQPQTQYLGNNSDDLIKSLGGAGKAETAKAVVEQNTHGKNKGTSIGKGQPFRSSSSPERDFRPSSFLPDKIPAAQILEQTTPSLRVEEPAEQAPKYQPKQEANGEQQVEVFQQEEQREVAREYNAQNPQLNAQNPQLNAQNPQLNAQSEAPNDIHGKNNLFLGVNNLVIGNNNYGGYNADSNKVSGDSNQLSDESSHNEVKGSGNKISGSGNIVKGHGNIILN